MPAAYSNARGVPGISNVLRLIRYRFEERHRFPAVKYRSFNRIHAVLETLLGAPLQSRTLLEIGCGQWRANVALFAALGNHVIGVDPELPPSGLREYLDFARAMGWQRAAKTLVSEMLFRRSFDRELQHLSGLDFTGPKPRLLRSGGERLPLPDDSVDAVFSDNVFEHLPDVEAVTAEMARVLRPGGYAYIVIHPFAAFSGGHHLATISHGGSPTDKPLSIPAWDHLREARYPAGVYLNRLREAEYRRIFERHLEMIGWERLGPEGEAYLTDEILRELPDFTREELLTGKLCFTGRKATSPATPLTPEHARRSAP